MELVARDTAGPFTPWYPGRTSSMAFSLEIKGLRGPPLLVATSWCFIWRERIEATVSPGWEGREGGGTLSGLVEWRGVGGWGGDAEGLEERRPLSVRAACEGRRGEDGMCWELMFAGRRAMLDDLP